MTNFLKELQDLTISRVKNTLFLTFIIAWATYNYRFTLKLLFSDISIEDKIQFIKNYEFTISDSLCYPLGITLFYILALPTLNLLLTMIKDVTVDKWIMDNKNNSLKNYYTAKRGVETEKVITENIAREYEIKLKEKELNLEKEGMDLKEFKDFKQFKTNNKYPQEAISEEEVESDFASSALSSESAKLLKEISLDSNGIVMLTESFGGTSISSNGEKFITSNEPREVAKWKGALDELQKEKLIIDESGKGEVFKITSLGYSVADDLKIEN